jgi:VWFA-related protein
MVAMMTPDMSPSDVQIVRKSAVMSQIMQDVTTWARRGRSVSGNDSKDDLYAGCYTGTRRAIADEMIERHNEMVALDALDNLVSHLQRTGAGRKAVITVTDGWRIFTANPSLLRDERNSRMQGIFGRGRGGFGGRGGGGGGGGNPRTRDDSGVSSSQMAECESDRSTLAMLDDSARMRRLVDDANRATVTMYPVFASGVAPVQQSSDDRRRNERDERRPASAADRAATLRELADNTDGFAVTDEKGMDPGVDRITADLGSYYLLSYTSSNTKLDGRFRSIAVRVKRPDVRVRARRGYRGVTAEELGDSVIATNQPGRRTPPSARVNARTALRLRTATWHAPSATGATVWIVGELDYRVRKELTWSAGATGDVVVLGSDGREIASRQVDVRPTDGRFSIRVPENGEAVSPGEYAVRVRLHPDADPAATVTETARLQVPRESSALGEPVIWRRGPSTGPQFMMTADPRFERTERIRIEVPTTTTSGMPTAHLLDRTGKMLPIPVQVRSRQDADTNVRWVMADLTLAPLGMGDYGIEVRLGGARQVATFSLVP